MTRHRSEAATQYPENVNYNFWIALYHRCGLDSSFPPDGAVA